MANLNPRGVAPPKPGDPVDEYGRVFGTVVRVEDGICWVRYEDGEILPFIWCFHDGPNLLIGWPGKILPPIESLPFAQQRTLEFFESERRRIQTA